MNRHFFTAAGIVVGAEMLLIASSRAADWRELAAIARSEKVNFQLDVANASERLANQCRTAIVRLDGYLNELGEKDRGDWHRALRWPELVEQMWRAKPDLEQLLALSKCFYASQPGLEGGAFLEVRTALDRYLHFQLIAGGRTQEQLEKEYVRRLEHTARLLESPKIDQNALREQEIWFAGLGQAPRLVEGLRGAMNHPNVVITVSQGMLPETAEQFQQEIKNSQWSVNTILGRCVEGMTYFTGKVTGALPKDGPNAVVELTMEGKVDVPHSTAHAGPFQIYSQSETAVRATKRLSWDGTQIVAEPAQASAAPDSAITGADVQRRRLLPGGLVGNRLDDWLANQAIRRAERSQGQALYEAASITEQTIAEQFDHGVGEQLAQWNHDVAYYYTSPLVRVGMLPASQAVPTKSGFSLQFHFRGASKLAAPSPPQEVFSGDINAYIHESAFTNGIQPYAGGGLWTDEFFARIQKESVGDYSVEMRIRDRQERWSLTLDWLRPWSSRITKDGIRFTLYARGFAIDGKTHKGPLAVKSTYVVKQEVGPDYRFERVGDVQVDAPAGVDPKAKEFVKRKLSGFFSDSFYADALYAPAGGAWDALSTFQVSKFELTDGWLRIEFRQTAPKKSRPSTPDSSAVRQAARTKE